jgi:hypothetical protein
MASDEGQSTPGTPDAQIPSPLEITSSMPPTEAVRTQAFAAPQTDEKTTTVDPVSQQDADRRLAGELARRGIPPDEVQRLLSRGREDLAPLRGKKRPNPALASPPELPPSEAFIPNPTVTLPEFRENTTAERIEADRLLTVANIDRRRGLYKQAEKECMDALQLVPSDAAAIELFGDIMQNVGRVDDAAYAYGRAKEADPKRKTAEKKYAELMLMQNKEIELLRQEFIPRNPSVAILFSAVLPGAGQLYNGELFKGVITLAAVLACTAAILWSPYGVPHSQAGLPNSLVLLLIVLGVIYLYAVIDAKICATRGKRAKSGWEV